MGIADLLAMVLPTFGLIAVGFAAGRLRLLPDSVGEGLASFVFAVGLPMLLMRSVAKASLPDISPWPFWLTYFTGVAIVWTTGHLLVRRAFRQDEKVAVIGGLTAAFSNLVLLGIPIVYTAYGEAGAVPLLLLVSVHLPVMATASAILFERIESRERGGAVHPFALARRIALNLVRNPLIIGIATGLVLNVSGIGLGGVPKAIVDQLADSAIACALFSMGLGLKRYGIRDNLAGGLTMACLKVVVMPAVVFLMATRVVGLPPLWTAVATTLAACPTGVNAYLFATRFGVGHGLASNGITLSTIAAVVTITGWMLLTGSYG